MDLTPNSDQSALQTATADWCRDNMPLDGARNRPEHLWRDLADMGWTGMTAPGMGLDHATEALVFAELGRELAPVGLLSTAVAARWIGGDARVALAIPHEKLTRVFDPQDCASALSIWGNCAGLLMLPASLDTETGLDLSAPYATIALELVPNPLDDPRAALHLQLLAAAYGVGVADAARDMAADYAKIREQFDRPIGWFQSLKHICADMAVRCEVARSQLYYAACALDAGGDDAAFHVAAAKRLADSSALDNGRANIQVHGGIGMTDEAVPHLCLKRAHLLSFIAPVDTKDLLESAA
ncbi:acyl-CoA dehydrogenase [Sphingorhabdus pulchriflava]|uniref:Acyl-CoA dehydrogenase n=1 Tax=Sphingorhabdus pulchriflava TaxID=2292257 RepID=A0A371BGV5_9SPHN|nr:acyl-CoA dehydrogenase family protein [Sphingorhabdus pulchriflava]RDV06591.1 acyl-CoA dehydrogenase [Sphingorhabdus pulchriflava]